MATVLQLPSGTSSADILRDYLTAAVCMSATQGCTGAASQYSSYADCAAMLAEKPLGQWDHMAGQSQRAPIVDVVGPDPQMTASYVELWRLSWWRTTLQSIALNSVTPEAIFVKIGKPDSTSLSSPECQG